MDATACSALSAAADPACGVATAPPWGMAFRERLTAAPRRLAAGLALCGIPAVWSPRSPSGPAAAGQDMCHHVCCRQRCLVQLCWKRQPLHSTLRNNTINSETAVPHTRSTCRLLLGVFSRQGACKDAPLWLPRWRCTGEGMSAYPGALPLLGVLPPPPPPVAAAAAPVVAAADAAALQGYKGYSTRACSHTGCKRSKCSARHCGTVSSLWSDGAQQRNTVMMPPTQRAHAQCSGQQAGNKPQRPLQTATR